MLPSLAIIALCASAAFARVPSPYPTASLGCSEMPTVTSSYTYIGVNVVSTTVTSSEYEQETYTRTLDSFDSTMTESSSGISPNTAYFYDTETVSAPSTTLYPTMCIENVTTSIGSALCTTSTVSQFFFAGGTSTHTEIVYNVPTDIVFATEFIDAGSATTTTKYESTPTVHITQYTTVYTGQTAISQSEVCTTTVF